MSQVADLEIILRASTGSADRSLETTAAILGEQIPAASLDADRAVQMMERVFRDAAMGVSRAAGQEAASVDAAMGSIAASEAGAARSAEASSAAHRRSLRGLESAAGSVESTILSMGRGAVLGLGLVSASIVGVSAVAGIRFDSIREQAQIAFTTMLGSGTKAKHFLDELAAFAAHTPFEFQGLVQTSQQLIAMGFHAQQVKPLMTAVGDAVAALGTGQQGLNEVVLALGQIQTKGRLQGQEALQLQQSGINIVQAVATYTGKSVAQVQDAMQKGNISAKTAIASFEQYSNQHFHGMMQVQSRTLSGLWSTFKDTFSQISGQVMAPFFGWAEHQLGHLDDFLGRVFKARTTSERLDIVVAGAESVGKGLAGMLGIDPKEFTSIERQVAGVASTIAHAFMSALPTIERFGKGILEGAGQLIDALKPLQPFLANIILPLLEGLATGVIVSVVGAFRVAVPVIHGVAVVLGAIGKAAAPLRPVFKIIGEALGIVFAGAALKAVAAVGKFIPFLRRVAPIAGAVGDAIGAISRLLGATLGRAAGLAGKAISTILDHFSGLKTGARIIWATVTTGIEDLWSGLWRRVPSILSGAVSHVLGFLRGLPGRIKSILEGIPPAVIAAAKAIGEAIIHGIESGVTSLASGLADKIKGAASDALGAAKSALGIGSPSRVFRDQVGVPIMLGLAQGIDQGAAIAAAHITKAMQHLTLGARHDANARKEELHNRNIALAAWHHEHPGQQPPPLLHHQAAPSGGHAPAPRRGAGRGEACAENLTINVFALDVHNPRKLAKQLVAAMHEELGRYASFTSPIVSFER